MNRINNKIYLLLVLLVTISLSSCTKKFEEFNIDPTQFVNATPEALLAVSVKRTGDWVGATGLNNGINVTGYDGNPKTPELTGNLASVLDLAIPHTFETPYDWIMSIEVGEHLPPQYEDIYIENLHNNNTKGIVMSWALEGQGGLGHFNEHSNEYIKNKMIGLGYTNDLEAENILRESSSLWWFKNTIMVFRKNA